MLPGSQRTSRKHRQVREVQDDHGTSCFAIAGIDHTMVESLIVPGFIIPVRALFDEAEQFAALQTLLERA